jgi:uncharacterized protein (DUF1501 family)
MKPSRSESDAMVMSRRRMLQGLLALGGIGLIEGVPGVRPALAGPPLGRGDRILVVVTLDGGNDTLSTLVPYTSGRYYDIRGSLAIAENTVMDVGDGLGLHPNLQYVGQRFNAGDVAFVRGIGEPTDEHSHFAALAKWMSGDPHASPDASGWLGRYLDALGGDSLSGVAIGPLGTPQLLRRQAGRVTGLPMLGDLFGADAVVDGEVRPVKWAHKHLSALGGADIGKGKWAQAVVATQAEAIGSAAKVNPSYSPTINDNLPDVVRDLTLAARVVNLDVGARVLHVRHNGFDTHNAQRPEHDDLLESLDLGLARFFDTLAPRYHDRVVVLCWSEFGRRIEPNGSGGVDHGSAGMALVLGSKVTGGHYGLQPSLSRPTDRGDLRMQVDYRSLYATVLDRYLGADSTEILGASYENLGIFDEAVYCDGQRATIVGTAGADRLRGTKGRDVIAGLGGNDVIIGGGGADTICGGDGNDTLRGGAGGDRLFGDRGNDRLSGEGGRDRLEGGRGRDQLRGGAGRDRLIRDGQDSVVRQ